MRLMEEKDSFYLANHREKERGPPAARPAGETIAIMGAPPGRRFPAAGRPGALGLRGERGRCPEEGRCRPQGRYLAPGGGAPRGPAWGRSARSSLGPLAICEGPLRSGWPGRRYAPGDNAHDRDVRGAVMGAIAILIEDLSIYMSATCKTASCCAFIILGVRYGIASARQEAPRGMAPIILFICARGRRPRSLRGTSRAELSRSLRTKRRPGAR